MDKPRIFLGSSGKQETLLRELTRGLDELVRNFEREMPSDGRYVRQPALADEGGLVSVPPRVSDPLPAVAAGVGLAVLAGLLMLRGGSDDRMTRR